MNAPEEPPQDVTAFLADLLQGEGGDDVNRMQHVLRELRVIAGAQMRQQGPAHTLQPTALVHAAYMKLFQGQPGEWKSRRHFFAVAAKAMRQILVDHARARSRKKRGGGRRAISLVDAAVSPEDDREVLDVDRALRELADIDARKAQIVELRYFAGLEVAEVVETLDISRSSVEREWRGARAWLAARLADDARD